MRQVSTVTAHTRTDEPRCRHVASGVRMQVAGGTHSCIEMLPLPSLSAQQCHTQNETCFHVDTRISIRCDEQAPGLNALRLGRGMETALQTIRSKVVAGAPMWSKSLRNVESEMCRTSSRTSPGRRQQNRAQPSVHCEPGGGIGVYGVIK